MHGWIDRWMNRGQSYTSSRCSIYIPALYIFACKRDVGRSPSSQLSALMKGHELTSAWVPGQCWGPAGTRAHHESPADSPYPATPHPPCSPAPRPQEGFLCVDPPCLEPSPVEREQDWLQSHPGGENTTEWRASRERAPRLPGGMALPHNACPKATRNPAPQSIHLCPIHTPHTELGALCVPAPPIPALFLSHSWSHHKASREDVCAGCWCDTTHPSTRSQLVGAPWAPLCSAGSCSAENSPEVALLVGGVRKAPSHGVTKPQPNSQAPQNRGRMRSSTP